MTLAALPTEVLYRILAHLSPEDLSRCCCASSALRAACSSAHIWQPICRQRWLNLASSLHDGHTDTDAAPGWKRLYESGNGWSVPAFDAVQFPDVRGFVCAFNVRRHNDSQAVVIASDQQVQLWQASSDDRDSIRQSGTIISKTASCQLDDDEILHSVIELQGGGGIVTADHRGCLTTYRHEPGSSALQRRGRVQLGSLPIIDMHQDPLTGHLVAMTDCTFVNAVNASTNRLQFVDLAVGKVVGTVVDPMEEYQLLCCGLASSCAAASSSPDVWVASVQGDFCTRCFEAGVPSLCFHKAQVHSAALCCVDGRVSSGIAQRYMISHRSLYPHLHVTRGQYICLSHAGCPLSVWDKRFMSEALFQEARLANCLDSEGLQKAAGGHLPPFGPPGRASIHQGLWLDGDGDVLVGRAENGMMWLWDLSRTIGWAADASSGPQGGSWAGLRRAMDDLQPFKQDWPFPLGALPSETTLPATMLPAGAGPCSLLCQVGPSVVDDDQLMVACLRRP